MTSKYDTELDAICAQFKSKIAINDLDGKILFIIHKKITNNETDDLNSICMKFGNSVKIVSGEECREIVRIKLTFCMHYQESMGRIAV